MNDRILLKQINKDTAHSSWLHTGNWPRGARRKSHASVSLQFHVSNV